MTDVPGPSPGVPGWFPDPSGRHQLRWFDGATFSDQVADRGVVSTDPGIAAPPPPPPPSPFALPPPPDQGRRRHRAAILIAVAAAVVLLAGGAVVVLRNANDPGFGTHTGSVAVGGISRHGVSIPAGSVVVVAIDPGADLDTVVGLAVDDETNTRLRGLFDDGPTAGLFGPLSFETAFGADVDDGGVEGDAIWFPADTGFAGEGDGVLIFTPFAVDGTIVVGGFAGSEGDYEITIEQIPIDIAEDASAQRLFDVVISERTVPRAARESLRDLLDLFD